MTESLEEIGLGDRVTVHTMPGRDDTVIGRMKDGRIILFDKDNQFFSLLGPGMIVECHVVALRENFVVVSPISQPKEIPILSPISQPKEIPISHIPELEVDDIVVDLEKLIKSVPKNAKVIPRALLRIIRLNQLIIKMHKGEI